MFGNSININNIIDDNKNIIVATYGYSFKYNSNEEMIIAHNAGVGDSSSEDYDIKIIDWQEKDGKLEITSKVMFTMHGAGDDYVSISKSSSIDDTISKVSLDDPIKIDDYLNKLYSYK